MPDGEGRAEARGREPAGFRDFVSARQASLLSAAYVLTGSRPAAEDLVQTALVRVWPHWERVAAGGNAEPYVRKAMLNTYLSWNRRLRFRETELDEGILGDLIEDTRSGRALTQVVDKTEVAALLRRLPRRQRAVVVLRYYADLTEPEIAEMLGCSVGTVKSQHSRALATLRRNGLAAGAQDQEGGRR